MKIELHNGDCLEVMKNIPSESVDCIVTDPPYGINYQSSRRTDKKQWKPKILNDKSPFIWFLLDAFRVLKVGGRILCFTRFDTENDFRWAMKIAGFTTKSQIIWNKVVHGMGDLTGDFASQHENIIYATKGRYLFTQKRPKTIFTVQRVSPGSLLHPNEKPIDLIKKIMEPVTSCNNTVLDCFMGSGTTGVACKNLGINFIGIELDKNYFEIAKNRIVNTPERLL